MVSLFIYPILDLLNQYSLVELCPTIDRMALSVVLIVGVAAAIFVGVNIGGSSTGVAFGPATGSGVLSMRQGSGLMAVFVFLGGFTAGTHVVERPIRP